MPLRCLAIGALQVHSMDALQSAGGERFAALGEGEDIRLKGTWIAGQS